MSKFKLLILCMAAWVGVSVMAQSNQTVEVGFDKKVIYTDSLALPHSVNVGALLRLLPELLQRPTDFVLSNYDVKVNDVSMSEADDAVLSILQLEDVEKIEVDNSPTSTDLNNGQSGSINIFLRPMATRPKGVSGSVGVGVMSDFTFTPNLMMDYRGEKLTVRAMAFGEFFDTNREERFQPQGWTQHEAEMFRQLLVRATAEYAFDAKRQLSFTLTEATAHDDEWVSDNMELGEGFNREYSRKIEESSLFLMSELKYIHLLTPLHKLTLMAKYTHTPLEMNVTDAEIDYHNHISSYGNNWQSEATLEGRLLSASDRLNVGYKVGVKGAIVNTLGFETLVQTDDECLKDERSEFRVKSLMPLAELTLAYGPLSMMLGTEYQWNSDDKDNNWTGRLAMIWQMNSDNRLRLHLLRMPLHLTGVSESMGFEYILGRHWGNHQLTTSAGMSYCDDTDELSDSRYYCTNLMGIYQYGKRFFCSLTGNLYSKTRNGIDGSDGYYNYFNLSLMPSVILGHGWRVATNLRFYSPVDSDESYSTPSTILQVNGGKSWGAWSVYAYARTPLTEWDRIENHHNKNIRYYQMIPASFGCGVTWRGFN